MSAEFQVAGHAYRAGKLNAIQQFHVVRRLAPIIGSLQSADLSAGMAAAGAGDADNMGAILGPLANAVAAMSDADTEYVLNLCLGVVDRQMPGGTGWAPIWSVQARRPMYDDIGMMQMLQIVGQVLRANVGDFTAALPPKASAAAAQ